MVAQAVVVSFAASLACLLVLLSRFGRGLALDRPNERSLHERPVPRTGGIAIAAGIASCLPFLDWKLWPVSAIAGLLAAISFADDLLELPTLVRLAAHFAAAGGVLVLEFGSLGSALAVLFLLAIVWLTNLYNFMDGADGLAGGMAAIGFGAYALAADLSGAPGLATLCAAIAAASGAFLVFNFPPARIFMGDAGSVPLGFLAGALGLVGWRDELWPLWFPLLAFAPFIGDATVTLLKRLARGERVWRAHREHYYQRLVRMGFGHRGAALFGYALMLACAAAAVLAREASVEVQAATFGGAVVVLAAMALWVDARWARHVRESGGASA